MTKEIGSKNKFIFLFLCVTVYKKGAQAVKDLIEKVYSMETTKDASNSRA